MPFIETISGKIWFADHRDPTVHRPPLILVHGAGGSHLDWPAELRRMPEANSIVPDLPGHGKSGDAGRNTVSGYATDIVALLDALKIEKAFIGGHSMGGAIAQTMALNYPERVFGLVLVGTGAKLAVNNAIIDGIRTDPEQVVALIMKWAWAKTVDEQMRRLGHKRLMETDPNVTYGDYQACNAFDVRDKLGQISVPVLVVGGTEDKMTPLKFSQYLTDNIPNAKLITIEGGGHMMALEQPLTVSTAVQQWLVEVGN